MGRGHQIEGWMSQNVICIAPERPVLEAVFLMKKNKIRLLPVTSGDHLLGVVTDRDTLNPVKSLHDLNIAKLYRHEEDIQVQHIMTTEMHTVTPMDHIATAANLLLINRINGLPVIEKKGSPNLVGVITTSDLLRAFLQLLDISNI
jgi:acetoin utilization protein AcuB